MNLASQAIDDMQAMLLSVLVVTCVRKGLITQIEVNEALNWVTEQLIGNRDAFFAERIPSGLESVYNQSALEAKARLAKAYTVVVSTMPEV
jgi:hypothetical protein